MRRGSPGQGVGLADEVAQGKSFLPHMQQASQRSGWAADMFGYALQRICHRWTTEGQQRFSVCNMALVFLLQPAKQPECAVIAESCSHRALHLIIPASMVILYRRDARAPTLHLPKSTCTNQRQVPDLGTWTGKRAETRMLSQANLYGPSQQMAALARHTLLVTALARLQLQRGDGNCQIIAR
jgi:hypothetical protein